MPLASHADGKVRELAFALANDLLAAVQLSEKQGEDVNNAVALLTIAAGYDESPAANQAERPAVTMARSVLRHCSAPDCEKSDNDPGVKLKACARCRIARYCSSACQKRAWRTHKAACFPPQKATNTSDSKSSRFEC